MADIIIGLVALIVDVESNFLLVFSAFKTGLYIAFIINRKNRGGIAVIDPDSFFIILEK